MITLIHIAFKLDVSDSLTFINSCKLYFCKVSIYISQMFLSSISFSVKHLFEFSVQFSISLFF